MQPRMKSKLIVALDVPTYPEAERLVRELSGVVDTFKVGYQLFTRVGPRIVEFLRAQGRDCFLDLKFHDIPHTVAKGVESAAALEVRMLTVHTAGGDEMLRAAAGVAPRPLLLGVTVLTSVDGDVAGEVARRAALAQDCGLDGVIASASEAAAIRTARGPAFLIVTPGIRPAGAAVADQKRVVPPAAAIRAGADYIVVGRPIVAAANPAQAAAAIVAELGAAG